MSLTKLFNRIIWRNNTTPAINEDNLNAMSKGLDDLDDRVIELAGTIMEDVPAIQEYLEQADELVDQMEELSQNPPYIGSNGNWYVWDTNIGAYVDSHIDASITVSIADITMLDPSETPYVTNTGTDTDPIFHLYIPRGKGITSIQKTGTSGLVDTYQITYSDGYSDTFFVTNGKTAYQYAVDGGYSGTEAQFETDLGNFQTYASNAQQGASDAEAYAKGTRGGTAVDSSDPAYHNNAQYFAGQSDTSAQASAGSATSAAGYASDSEAYGAGTRNGVDVDPSDPAYHNNAKYYSQQAAGTSFAGLSDVDIDSATLANGQVPVYNALTGKWENGAGGNNGMETDGSNADASVEMTGTQHFAVGDGADASGTGAVAFGSKNAGLIATNYTVPANTTTETALRTISVQYKYLCLSLLGPVSDYDNIQADGYYPLSSDIVLGDEHAYIRLTNEMVDNTDYWKIYGFNDTSEALSFWYGYTKSDKVVASGDYSHAEGINSIASAKGAHAESQGVASGSRSHAEGTGTASGGDSHAEGSGTASGGNAHAEGYNTTASGWYTHAEGNSTTASGAASHAEGTSTTASEMYAHAEGYNTTASLTASHAEGYSTTASGGEAHAEGYNTTAVGNYSHAEGVRTKATGQASHAGGEYAEAYGVSSFVQGGGTYKFAGTGMGNTTVFPCFGVNPGWQNNTVSPKNGASGECQNNVAYGYDLEAQAMYLLFISTYTKSNGNIYGQSLKLITTHANTTGTPTITNIASGNGATVAAAANNRITITNAGSSYVTQIHLIRII